MKELVCKYPKCGKTFSSITQRRFCSHSCRCKNWELEHPGNRAKRQKKYLASERGRETQKRYYRTEQYRESQRRAYHKSKGPVELDLVICPECKRVFFTARNDKIYCTIKCKRLYNYKKRSKRNGNQDDD